jgi:hypothetical protein
MRNDRDAQESKSHEVDAANEEARHSGTEARI